MRPTRRVRLASLGLAVLALALAVWVFAPRRPVNVLLITLDTTRSDRLGCYGYAGARTPALDRAAADGRRFTHAYCQVPLTLPSHATLLTGRLPPEHGVRDNEHSRLARTTATLPQVLHDHGYRTAAFLASFVLDRRFGLDRGFDVYDDRMGPPRAGQNVFGQENRGDVVCDRALAWLESHARESFFCWVHFYDPHAPCLPPAPFDKGFADDYDGEIAFMDTQVGRLLDFLDRRGLRDRTLVVICGDHGEGLGEHGESEHGLLLHGATMRVPLILRLPGRIPAGLDHRLAGVSDVAVTMLDLLNLRPAGLGGVSLLSRAAVPEEKACYGETLYPFVTYHWSPLASLTTARWKYVLGPEPELYDLRADPSETRNLAAREPRVADALRDRLERLRLELKPLGAEKAALDGRAVAQLRSLGYVAGVSKAMPAGETATNLPNPATMIVAVHNPCTRATQFLDRGEPRQAAAILEEVLPRSPQSPEIRQTLVNAYLAAGDVSNALPHIEMLMRLTPDNRLPFVNRARIALNSGDYQTAVTCYRQALALPAAPAEPLLAPGVSEVEVQARADLGFALMKLRQFDEAAAACRLALAQAPNHVDANNTLGNIHVLKGQVADAIRQYRKVLAVDPTLFRTAENLGQLLYLEKQYGEALAVWRKRLERHPGEPVFLYHLAWRLTTCPDGRWRNGPEAVKFAVALCDATDHANAQALDALAAAYAEAGDFVKAREIAGQAVDIALNAEGGAGLAEEIKGRLRLYSEGRAYRQ